MRRAAVDADVEAYGEAAQRAEAAAADAARAAAAAGTLLASVKAATASPPAELVLDLGSGVLARGRAAGEAYLRLPVGLGFYVAEPPGPPAVALAVARKDAAVSRAAAAAGRAAAWRRLEARARSER
jgi:hypothetical protein